MPKKKNKGMDVSMSRFPTVMKPHNATQDEAKVFLPKSQIDLGTMKQMRQQIEHASVRHPRFMPDCHRGKGCCVGFTGMLTTCIVPQWIGNDIGCGVCTYPLGSVPDAMGLEKFEALLLSIIPTGTETLEGPSVTRAQMEDVLRTSREDARRFARAYEERFGVSITPYVPDYSYEWFLSLCRRCGINVNRDVFCSLGTLGGGNHFVEVNVLQPFDQDEALGVAEAPGERELYLTIHSGSRQFGQALCKYHQDKISSQRRVDWQAFADNLKKARRKVKVPKELHRIETEMRATLEAERHAPYLEGEEMYAYCFDMILAQHLAGLNRRVMIRNVLEEISVEYNPDDLIESVHNYIDMNDMVIRKGAIAAHEGQQCIVALNMRDGSLLCRGKGNQDWNYSCAHGAGRRYARDQAAAKLSMKEFEADMEGIVCSVVQKETLDESPAAYKDSNLILRHIEPTVTIETVLRPVICLKGIK